MAKGEDEDLGFTFYEHEEGHVLGDNDTDGMAEWIADAEANGWEGEHVFDANVEDPPHPWHDPATGKTDPNYVGGYAKK
jgi:hypothetical protein